MKSRSNDNIELNINDSMLNKQKRLQQYIDNATILRNRLRRNAKRANFDEIEYIDIVTLINDYYIDYCDKAKYKFNNNNNNNEKEIHKYKSDEELREMKQMIENRIKNQIDINTEL